VYSHPRERVLFSPIRDANPAFSLAESLWMLSGRNDGAFLNLFIKDFGERFAEPDGTIHGAYGYRWRKAFGFDQLKYIARRLIENPNDRQCILQMWDCSLPGTRERLIKREVSGAEHIDIENSGMDDLLDDWKDRPCNTHVYFRVRDGLLDMGVCCRSNDIIMGAYGANAVHFSILQEYMAAMIDVGVGTYTQFSFNYHLYEKDLANLAKRHMPLTAAAALRDDRYSLGLVGLPFPLVSDVEAFDEDVRQLLSAVESKDRNAVVFPPSHNKFLCYTAWPLFLAYLNRDLSIAKEIEALDWRIALTEWLQRRQDKRRGK
jgi:hypothetical protein